MRYHDILEYDIRIDPALYDYQILKLTLQPLVENALYHGIKYKRAKGYIHVSGEKDGDVLRLSVRDDGVGMDECELEQLRREIRRPCRETEKGSASPMSTSGFTCTSAPSTGWRFSPKGRGNGCKSDDSGGQRGNGNGRDREKVR